MEGLLHPRNHGVAFMTTLSRHIFVTQLIRKLRGISRLLAMLILLSVSLPGMGAEGGGGEMQDYVAMDAPFVVNLFSRDTVHFVKFTTQFKLKNPALAGSLKTHFPAIRHGLIMLVSDKPYFEMTTIAGKAKLRDEALEVVRNIMLEESGDPTIENIYFTSLIVQ